MWSESALPSRSPALNGYVDGWSEKAKVTILSSEALSAMGLYQARGLCFDIQSPFSVRIAAAMSPSLSLIQLV